MKKLLMLLCSMLFIAMAAACSNVDEETEKAYIAKGEDVVALLNAGDFAAVAEQFDAKMASELTAEQLAQVKPILDASGAFEKFEKQSVQQSDDHFVVVLVAKHVKEQRIYTVTYNAANEVAGLFVQ